MNRLKAKKLSAGIEQLTRREEYEANARELGERVSGIDGAKNAVRVVERLQSRLREKSISFSGYPRTVGRDGRRRGWAPLSGKINHAPDRTAALRAEDSDEAAGEG
jgi:hypothetical protein